MCDYSLQLVASRPAKVGEKLVSARFPNSITRGFVPVGERTVAVCLLPGTELAFEEEVQCETAFVFRSRRPTRAQGGSVPAGQRGPVQRPS